VDVKDGRRRESEQIEGESRGCLSRVPVEGACRKLKEVAGPPARYFPGTLQA